MPIYEYKCSECGGHHEFIQKFSDAPKKKCPECGGKLEKLISSTSFVLKGSGWYVTDYASGDRKAKMDADKGKSKKSKESDKKDKPEGKSESRSGSKSETAKKEKSATQ